MSVALSEIIKDLLAKIPVLENSINTLSTKITNINNNGVKKVSNSAPEGNTLTLVEGAVESDGFRIIVGDEGKDNLYASFDTCDNGDEKIQFRQYVGHTNPYPDKFFGTPIRTAVILGRNGETTFPVSVTAPKFVGSLKGNADTATKIVNNGNRNNLPNGTKAPSGLSVYQCYAHAGYPQPYGNVISIGGTGDNELFLGWRNDSDGPRPFYRSKIDVYDNWTSWKPLAYYDDINALAPTKTGGGASGTWNINITGNADTLDGYHASDLLRTLGGNKAPVMTDIFDRAGTIDLSAMNATDKANNKAKINKSPNSLQNIWNTSTGIAAYGGDIDMSNGYARGTLKLTQSYKDFDKILVVATNDDGNIVFHKLWNVYELAYMFSHSYRFSLYNEGAYWRVYGSVRTGAATNYSLSTDTIWSCDDQNCGIVAIYGIKY